MSTRIAYPKDWPEEARQALDSLFALARKDGLWFRGPYHDVWFSPDELQKEQEGGQFFWSAENWALRYPGDHLAVLKRRVEVAKQELETFDRRLKAWLEQQAKA